MVLSRLWGCCQRCSVVSSVVGLLSRQSLGCQGWGGAVVRAMDMLSGL